MYEYMIISAIVAAQPIAVPIISLFISVLLPLQGVHPERRFVAGNNIHIRLKLVKK
ncbi:hypothetical protein NDS46_08475 [Paenibacillus thiaminolyticus]|uniref:hypothetical protein n=1 Tax=Paenibacillus thiaminolyticus TaxID=49283 RepID=UPI00232B0ED2|nr:hypothetical protein [Paenibacillus thiaminolyticus]WCF09873.1 hypothetical protein NDS46_08475 [Paenibacillus thiaminolyticus]